MALRTMTTRHSRPSQRSGSGCLAPSELSEWVLPVYLLAVHSGDADETAAAYQAAVRSKRTRTTNVPAR